MHEHHVEISLTIIQNAIIAIILISIISSIIGSILVSNKIVFIGGAIAHCAYGGIGAAIFYGFSTLLGAGISTVVVALIISYVKQKLEGYIDVFMAILWTIGMSIGVIFIDLKHEDIHIDIENYLFGSLFNIDSSLLIYMGIFDVFLIVFTLLYYREILSISYDIIFCRLRKINTYLFSASLFILISIGIILSMQISGLILVLAMLSIPSYSANIFAKSMRSQIFLSFIFSMFYMLVGFIISILIQINVGASITLFSIVAIILIYIITTLKRKKNGKRIN